MGDTLDWRCLAQWPDDRPAGCGTRAPPSRFCGTMKTGKPEDLLALLRPGRVYFQGGPGECTAFIDLLKANPGAAKGVELWSCLIPGINTFDYGSLPGGPNLVTFMASPALEPSIAKGRTDLRAK